MRGRINRLNSKTVHKVKNPMTRVLNRAQKDYEMACINRGCEVQIGQMARAGLRG